MVVDVRSDAAGILYAVHTFFFLYAQKIELMYNEHYVINMKCFFVVNYVHDPFDPKKEKGSMRSLRFLSDCVRLCVCIYINFTRWGSKYSQ